MSAADHPEARRARRRILVGGVLALLGLYVAGAFVEVPRIEAELSVEVDDRLAAAGIAAVSEFSGQDGTLRCAAPLTADQSAVAVREAQAVRGVRVAELDASCSLAGGGAAPTTAVTTTPPTTTPPTTTTPETTPPTTVAPTTVAVTTTVPAAPVQVEAQLVDGRLVLTGTVASDLERLALIERATSVVTFGNVSNQLVVDTTVPALPGDDFVVFLDLMMKMPPHLVTGSVRWAQGVQVSGTYASDTLRAAFGAAAAAQGVAADLTPRPTATAAQAIALEAELNSLVAAEPILFEKGSTVISEASLGTVQRVAGLAERYAGVAIDVQGHTDSEGDAGRNLTLSQQRAQAVLDALVALGVPATDLTATGFGLTQLVTDADGNEIPEKSRRVVFGVTTV
jgi:outer membrane protein OmpA-like peptidoglycan-associated protein